MQCILINRRQKEIQDRWKRRHCTHRGRDKSQAARDQDMLAVTRSWENQGTESPRSLHTECGPTADILDFNLLILVLDTWTSKL